VKDPVLLGSSGEEIALEIDSAGSLSAVICCHGFCSERTSDGRFLQLSETLTARGFDVIRFDFRGCGDSADAVLTETTLLDDLLRVLRFAKERGYHRLFLHGHSLGSYLCMAVCSRYPEETTDVAAMALTGCMTGPMHYDWSLCYSAEEMRELAETRVLTLNGLRPDDRVTRVSASLLERFDTVDQAALCNGILCPTLLINGGGDDEERRLAANSVRAISLLPAGSRLLVLSEASHNFRAQYPEVIRAVAGYFQRML
jgi:pimeloyl-ACP methyl ester carboxylesterase